MSRTPKVLFYDIEVTPLLGRAYGVWDTNIIRIEEYSYVMCFSYRWSCGKKTYNVALPDFKELYKKNPKDDSLVVKALWDLIDEADCVVGHNANGFDNKVANTSFIMHNMTPPSPYRSVDTLQVARRIGKFPSNALGKLGEQLGLGSKSKTTHGDLWHDCMQGDMKAWKKMIKYNNQDVDLLIAIYNRLLPYMNQHPNFAMLSEDITACPKCGSHEREGRGYRYTNTSSFKRFICKDCGGWYSERIGDKNIVKPTFTNF